MQAAHQPVNQKNPKNVTVRTMYGYNQIWDGFMWLTPGYGHWNTQGPLCWEQQQNHSKQNQPNYTQHVNKYLELCEHSVTLKESDWFGTNRPHCPGVY